MVLRERFLCFGIVALLLGLSATIPAQIRNPNAVSESDLGSLTFGHAHSGWPAPENLVRDLRAGDDHVRLRALLQLGVPKSATTIREAPDEVLLRYASLGTDFDEQAIVAVSAGGAMLFGAVAVQENGVWQRIANFSCWCKYERGDLLGNFIQIESAPDGRSELVLHASGGGTGVYSQDEAHFRYHRGELRLVLSFVSQFRECDPTAPGPYTCRVERRWFYDDGRDSTPGGILVESHLNFLPERETDAEFAILDLQLRHAKTLSCRPYEWDKEQFAYKGLGAGSSSKCRPPSQ